MKKPSAAVSPYPQQSPADNYKLNQFDSTPPVDGETTTTAATGGRRWSFETAKASFSKVTTSPLSRASLDVPATQRYRLGSVLGIGTYGTVYLAVDISTGEGWACKVVSGSANKAFQMKEIELLRQIDHPSIVRYREHFTVGDKLHMITELVRGKDLGTAIRERGSYAEEDARIVTVQLLEALHYLSAKGIAHRDIKPANIMLVSNDEHTRIKIIDFGFGDQLTLTKRHFSRACGTPTHVAPEVIAPEGGKYNTTCDVWSAGVTLYKLLSGDDAFTADSMSTLVRLVRGGEVWFNDPVWELVSPEAQELVQSMLDSDPTKRVTPCAALSHRWLQGV
uniref:Protein kinase domain-containing protein n=1 Tax=Tetraselmis chuii TaxID=63592 RepID=A0A7S1SJL4_9CHLO|mmetsp:Transcript_11165/g.20148  ORF Transcript_11165/g.20148 Transcript_11165/m.20148 type:complete len:336 (+) Transcript_11165:127-1134(+)|eukprot:CAMPEP_0177753442 /NCGR_PEP_ID=MMETSP0491_2-20121128/1464_1 /TAXON_ID=63592 /ORGANISM="Tetraselmis chuii, Strain PLY429" /LENGTH=335 /DNA_ID=CAMNT_0019268731 /DNA_START=111 /DNA_END=1118 /DNA_ORIENTATION=+